MDMRTSYLSLSFLPVLTFVTGSCETGTMCCTGINPVCKVFGPTISDALASKLYLKGGYEGPSRLFDQ